MHVRGRMQSGTTAGEARRIATCPASTPITWIQRWRISLLMNVRQTCGNRRFSPCKFAVESRVRLHCIRPAGFSLKCVIYLSLIWLVCMHLAFVISIVRLWLRSVRFVHQMNVTRYTFGIFASPFESLVPSASCKSGFLVKSNKTNRTRESTSQS